MKLLIVDDNWEILDTLSKAMTLFGYRVEIAHDGIDALDLLQVNRYDIVITDADMPRLDGIKLSELVKSSFPEVRIIGMSGTHSPGAFKAAGAEIFLSKPFTILQLRDAIEESKGQRPH